MRRPRRSAPPARPARRPPDAAATEAEAPDPTDARWRLATAVAVAIVTTALAIVAFGFHPIGDYFTESDFYGAYATGAELIRRGRFDPSRYGIYGPVYEIALALVGALVGDAFTAARLISVASAMGALAALGGTARRLEPAAAFWLVVLVGVNATFFRYGYSVGTDMLATGLGIGGMCALLSARAWRAPLLGGALVGLAALTRYNLVSLAPAGLVTLLAARSPRRERAARVAVFVATFGLLVAPFAWWAAAAGRFPGTALVKDASFYLSDEPSQELERRYRGLTAMAPPDAATAPSAATLGRRVLTGVPSHLVRDARELLRWPTAGLALASVALLVVRGGARRLAAFVPYAAFGLLALAPVYYSERYSFVLLPLYVAPAALALGIRRTPRVVRGVLWLGALLGIAFATLDSVSVQRAVHESIPVEALSAGRALRAVAHPGERVLARKAHVAYASGLEPVLFPEVGSLDSLAEFCRGRGVGYLYYSWYESRTRPQFSYLLDTSLAVPGLVPLAVTRDKPSVTYAITPEFGREPVWGMGARSRRVQALGGAWIRTPRDSGYYYARMASDLLAASRPEDALASADAAARLLPQDADPLVLRGEALVRMNRPREALAAFVSARELRPRDVGAQIGCGWALFALGERAAAGRAWRPVIDAAGNPAVLNAMIVAFTGRGDLEAVARARRALATLGSPRHTEP